MELGDFNEKKSTSQVFHEKSKKNVNDNRTCTYKYNVTTTVG